MNSYLLGGSAPDGGVHDGTSGEGSAASETSKAVHFWTQFAIYIKNGGAGTYFRSYGVPTMTPLHLSTAVACMLQDTAVPLTMRRSGGGGEDDSGSGTGESDQDSSSDEDNNG